MHNIQVKIPLILTIEDINRIQFIEYRNEIIVDLHGMKCYEAKRLINNLLNLTKGTVKMIIIHGYHHGTAIKDMIQTFKNSHITEIIPCESNLGKTYILAA